MKHLLIATALFALTTSQVTALSCGPEVSVAQQFIWAKDSPDDYVIVKGKMTVQKASKKKVPPKNDDGTQEEYTYNARFKGQSLNTEGFTSKFTKYVKVHLHCTHGWCAKTPPPQERLYFLQKVKSRYLLVDGPCNFTMDSTPSAENTRILQQCMSGGRCKP